MGKTFKEWARRWDRRKNKKLAEKLGLFWNECPICGTEFGGHEWEAMDCEVRFVTYEYTPGYPPTLQGVCPECCAAGNGRTPEEVLRDFESWA